MSNYWIARIHLIEGSFQAPVEPANSLISELRGNREAGFMLLGSVIPSVSWFYSPWEEKFPTTNLCFFVFAF